jgi:hypothetical protein
MTGKRQTLQGYIIRILQHFATKLRNITNFVMLFQAVMKFLSRSKFCSLGIGPLLTSLPWRDFREMVYDVHPDVPRVKYMDLYFLSVSSDHLPLVSKTKYLFHKMITRMLILLVY